MPKSVRDYVLDFVIYVGIGLCITGIVILRKAEPLNDYISGEENRDAGVVRCKS